VARFADVAMYDRKPMDPDEDGEVRPRVTLISMTVNPLRVMAAACELYRGNVIHNSNDISVELALFWLSEMTKTKLANPLELIDLHFLIENVTRAFTHQMVRQRIGATYVQESMRFSVVGDEFETRMPPTLAKLNEDDPRRASWERGIRKLRDNYRALIAAGVPAEDARGILPTNITTRIHYKTTLLGLAQHAGMRLCTQAQYEWKEVWREMISAILGYGPASEAWQQRAIVSLFRPVCYATGKCEFMAQSDRFCAIRDRVEAHHKAGHTSAEWDDISPLEPLTEGAARLSPDMAEYMGRTR
jgi:flavin-dependent thymidylate synthase